MPNGEEVPVLGVQDPEEDQEQESPGASRIGIGSVLFPERTEEAVEQLAPVVQSSDFQEPSETGVVGNLFAGVAQGLLEPLGFIDPIEQVLERLDGVEADSTAERLGRGIGFLGGFLVPGAGALKIGAIGTKALKITKTADAFADLGHFGNLARGAIAGGVIGAGRAAEDAEDRVAHIVSDAALFGVGDLVAPPLIRVIGQSRLAQATKKSINKALGRVMEEGRITDVDGAVNYARALAASEDLFQPKTPTGLAAKRAANRRARVASGLDDLGLKGLEPGQVRMLRTTGRDAADINKVLDLDDDLDNVLVEYIDPRNQKKMADVLVAPKGQLDQRIVDSMRKEGFFPGQRILWNGGEYKILRKSKSGNIIASRVGERNKRTIIKTPDYTPLPFGAWAAGPSGLKNAPKLWADFVARHGEFPDEGFDSAFNAFVRENAVSGEAKDELAEFFLTKQLEALRELDPVISNTLKRLKAVKVSGDHVEGSLHRMANEQGFLLKTGIEDGADVLYLQDIREGWRTPSFTFAEGAREFLRNSGRRLDEAFPELVGNPIAGNWLGLKGSGVQVPHSASEIGNVEYPLWLVQSRSVMPRAAWIRLMDDVTQEQMGLEAPRIFGTWSKLQEGITQARIKEAPWINRLIKSRGVKAFGLRKVDSPIEVNKTLDTMELMFKPRGQWERIAKERELPEKAVKAMGEIRDYLDELFEEFSKNPNGIELSASDYFENYFRVVRHNSAKTWEKALNEHFRSIGKEVDPAVVEFIKTMERTGQGINRWEKDPFMFAIRYTRALFRHTEVRNPLLNMEALMKSLPDQGTPGLIKRSLQDYVRLSFGAPQEAFFTTKVSLAEMMNKLDIDLEPRDAERFFNGMIGLNYGAFMGFRPALAVRNATQTLVTTYPMVGASYTRKGIKAALTKAGRDEAEKAGAILPSSVAAQLEDTIYKSRLAAQIERASGRAPVRGKVAGTALKTLETAQQVGQFGLSGRVKIGNRSIPTGLYVRADEWNRAVAYHAQRLKILDEARNWRGGSGAKGHGNIEVFNAKSGLRMMGATQTREFHRRMATDGLEEAAKWAGVQMANETQWIYQLGAGPALFSSVPGRLFGMYGTWPTWYMSHIARGLRMQGQDKALFFARSAALAGALAGGGYVTVGGMGVNTSRWSPINSLAWTGSPVFDMFKDVTDVIGGVGPSGRATAQRQLALSKFGLRDRGEGLPLPPGLPGARIEISDPVKALTGPLSFITPGALQIRSMLQAADEPNSVAAGLRFIGFSPVVGQSWPEITISRPRRQSRVPKIPQ